MRAARTHRRIDRRRVAGTPAIRSSGGKKFRVAVARTTFCAPQKAELRENFRGEGSGNGPRVFANGRRTIGDPSASGSRATLAAETTPAARGGRCDDAVRKKTAQCSSSSSIWA
jgi:hypothetical protein